ncbi:MAG: glycosyltransferase family 4 protein [Candidatus Margulisiibacteriota bacterium]
MQKKTVFLISHQADLSGAPLSLFYLARELNKQDEYKVVYIVPERGPLLQKLKAENIETIVLGSLKELHFIRLIKKYRPSLLHVNTSVNWYAALIGRLLDTPVIWHIREDLSGHPWLVQFIVRYSNRIIAISASVRDYFPERYQYKISIVYNAVDAAFLSVKLRTSAWQKAKNILFPDSFAHKKNIKIGYLGSIEPRKGIKELTEAFFRVNLKYPLSSLHIAGRVLPVAKGYHQKIIKFCLMNGIDKSVFWHGSIDDIIGFFNKMDIIVVPSLSEPFGRVVIEAMAAGKPVIGSTCGGIPEIIQNGKTGFLCEPGNSIDLSRVIFEVMNMHSDDITDIINNAHQMVVEKFSLDKQITKVLNIYSSVLENND